MKTIKYNGQEYRVRSFRIGRDVNWAANRACEKCCFARGGDCDLPDGPDCTAFNKRNRRGVETHYAYFQKVNPDSPWPDIAIGLVALAVAAVLGLLCTGCSRPIQKPEIPSGDIEIVARNGDSRVRKARVEGHEYLIFEYGYSCGGAVYSESCPCKAKEGGK